MSTSKKQLWGGEFWTDGYFASTVGKHGDENMISKYVQNQGKEYNKLHTTITNISYSNKNSQYPAASSGVVYYLKYLFLMKLKDK